MHRFFLPPPAIQDGSVAFPPEIGHQICRVLRLKSGQVVTVLDNQGGEFRVELVEVENHHVSGRVVESLRSQAEPWVRLFMYLCLSQREKFELMLQKCTEIGVSGFIPLISSRSLVQEREDKGGRRRERWEGILREAAEQSGRGRIPELFPPLIFTAGVEQAVQAHTRVLIPTLDLPGRQGIGTALAGMDAANGLEIGVIIGPEGGFSEEEVEQARSKGCRPVDLGRRVLRMETAAMVSAALVLYEFGEMG